MCCFDWQVNYIDGGAVPGLPEGNTQRQREREKEREGNLGNAANAYISCLASSADLNLIRCLRRSQLGWANFVQVW